MHTNNQSGKSMVEMLAVMAIMAVLSITGIYAYNIAMTKHKANELIHKANLAYMNVLSHDSLDSWTDLKITSIDGTSLQGVIYKDAGFVLVENIDKDICNIILKDKTNYSLLTLNNVALTSCETINNMVFDFANAGDFGKKCVSGHCPEESSGQYCSTVTGTCVMEEDCASGLLWNFEKDTCDTCEGLNGESAPVFSENGCISCAESDATKPIWDFENKTCVNCLSDLDCELGSYCNNNTCMLCPLNSSGTVTEEQIESTSCYCNSGYVWDDTLKMCVLPITESCTDGLIVTAKNGVQYCVSSGFLSHVSNASAWCSSRKMSLQSVPSLCNGINPGYQGSCQNLNGVADIGFVWTNTVHSSNHFYVITLSGGWVGYSYVTGENAGYYVQALCR